MIDNAVLRVSIVARRLLTTTTRLAASQLHPDALARAAALSRAVGVLRQVAADLDFIADLFEEEAGVQRSHDARKEHPPCSSSTTSPSGSCSGA